MDLVMKYPDIFHNKEHYNSAKLAPNTIQSSSVFSVSILQPPNPILSQSSQQLQQLQQQQPLSSSPQVQQPVLSNELVFTLEPQQSIIIQLKFRPDEIGRHENALILRNNLTILDVYMIEGEAGTAELRIDDKEPMRTSVLFNAKLNEQVASNFKLADMAKLSVQMNEADFELCKAEINESGRSSGTGSTLSSLLGSMFRVKSEMNSLPSHQTDENKYILSACSNCVLTDAKPELLELDSTAPNHPAYFQRLHYNYSSSYKTKQGIFFLRPIFKLTNIGSTDLVVYQILFDGEACFSQGMRSAYCRPFTVAPSTNALLDIRLFD